MTDRMYVFTRKDLKPGYQAVQSCHAVALMGSAPHWDGYIILLATRNLSDLRVCLSRVQGLGLDPKVFREPDLGMQITAFAVMVPDHHWSSFKHLDLALKHKPKIRERLKGLWKE